MAMDLPPIESVRVRVINMRLATGHDLMTLDPEKLMRVDDPTSVLFGQTYVVEEQNDA